MTRTEVLILVYTLLAALTVGWGVFRITRAVTVRKAVESLPVAMLPGWAATTWVAYVSGGLPLALKSTVLGCVVLTGLWLMRFGVDRDSGMLETLAPGVDDTRLTSASS